MLFHDLNLQFICQSYNHLVEEEYGTKKESERALLRGAKYAFHFDQFDKPSGDIFFTKRDPINGHRRQFPVQKGGAINMEMRDGSKVLRPADVSIKTLDGSVIDGKVNLGYENRISDLFTTSERPFIVLFDAMHFGAPKKEVLVLNKQFIVWVKPQDEKQGTAEAEITN